MTVPLVARICLSFSSRRWLVYGGSAVVALCLLLLGARPAHAQTIYHVDDDADDGLVAYWQFDSPSEITIDYRNLITATISGHSSLNASFTTDVPTLLRPNPRSVTLDGVDDLFTVLGNTGLNLNGDFTVAVWVKRDTINSYEPIYDAGFGSDDWWFFISGNIAGTANDNRLGFGIRNVEEYYGDTIIPADGQWRHVAMVLDTSTTPNLRFYLNGVLDGSANVTHTIDIPSGSKQIGAISDGASLQTTLDGQLDELRIYNRVLSQSEIALLASGRTCVADGLSWPTAFPDLHCALELSVFNDTIRVAKGRYLPGVHPAAQFILGPGENVQGGFNGDEATNVARPPINLDPASREDYLDSSQYTIITGDLLGNDPLDDLTGSFDPEDDDNLRQLLAISTAAVGTNLDGVVVTGARSTGVAGGGATIEGSPVIANSIFLYNSADYGGGLAIAIDAAPQLNNLRFVRNRANIHGGGITSEGQLLLTNTLFITNSASVEGGGLDVRRASATLTNVDFVDNQAARGGAIYLASSLLSFLYNGGQLIENKASSGGAIYADAGATLNDLTLQANSAINEGGGIFSIGPLTINGSTFLSNTQTLISPDPVVGGGAISTRHSITLTDSTLQGNSADSGGGLRVEDLTEPQTVSLSNVTVRGNGATDDNGGGVYLRTADHPLNANLTDVIFEDNFTDDDEGAGLAANGGGAEITLTALRVTVRNNNASQNGGGMSMEGNVQPAITDSLFEGNEAAASGGGLYIVAGSEISPTLTNVTFRNNHATNDRGGGLFFCCTSGVLRVENLLFEENSSQTNGGGLNVCCGASLTGEHLTLHGNQSAANGGGLALCCTSGISSLQHVTVTANSAMTDGGGIHLTGGATISLTNGILISNTSEAVGGAVFGEFGADFALTKGRIEGNSAQISGGGIFLSLASVQLTGVQFIRNSTDNSGGSALSLSGANNSVLKEVDFIENSSGDDDGAAIRLRTSNALMDQVSFFGNAANQSGGAISMEESQALISNGLFVGNIGNAEGDAPENANAFHLIDVSSLHLINSTLAANSGDGDALAEVEESSRLTLTNIILWDNVPPTIRNDGTASLVEQNVISGSLATGIDPLFVANPNPGDGSWATLADNDYGNLRLRFNSPALDQGDGLLLPAGISQDFNGDPRIFDIGYVTNAFTSPVDLGAYEARFVAPTANAGGPYSGNEGESVALDGSASSDEGGIVTYGWDCTDDNSFDVSSNSPTGQSCTYPDQGEFTVRLRVTDTDGISNESTVAVIVSNLPPSAQDDSVTTLEDTPITVTVLTNDSDVAADPLTLTAVGAPTSGSALIEGAQVVYTPTDDFNGSASFSYTISDGDGGSATATVTVTITPVNDPDDPNDPEGATILLPMLSKAPE